MRLRLRRSKALLRYGVHFFLGDATGAGKLSEKWGGLLGTTLLAKDLFRGDPRDLGVIGAYSSESTRDALLDVDRIVVFGASLPPDTTTSGGLFARAGVVQIDADQAAFHRFTRAEHTVVGDARLVAERLGDAVASRPARVAPPGAGTFTAPAPASGPLDPRVVGAVLEAGLPSDRQLIFDSGRFLRSTARTKRLEAPGLFRMTVDAGSISLGIGPPSARRSRIRTGRRC